MAKQEFESFTGKLDAPTEFEPFDGTLDGAPPEPAGALSDLGKSLKVGVQKLPGMVTGLADLPIALATGARPFTSAADALGDITGFQPGKWADETQRSDDYKAGQANFIDNFSHINFISFIQIIGSSRFNAILFYHT